MTDYDTEEWKQVAAGRTGQAFSNHSSYEVWAVKWCDVCVHDDDEKERYCPILTSAMMGVIPSAWKLGPELWECDKFQVPEDEPEKWRPPVELPGQMDLFGGMA